MELDKYIKKVLIDKNVKQVELAEKLNISRASLGGLISRNKMGVDKLEDIADALNIHTKKLKIVTKNIKKTLTQA